MATLFDDLFLVLGALAFLAIVLYLFFGGVYRAFQRVGFTAGEAALILAGTFIGGQINIPLFAVNDWILAVNVGGAVVPVAVTFIVLRRNPTLVTETLAGAALVALVTFLVTTPTEQGIVSPFPLYLLPPLAAAGLSTLAFWREESQSAPLAYMIGTLGAIIGADVFRLAAFLSQAPPEAGAVAAIGGGAVLDMVYLTGILAVGLDAMFFNRLRKEQDPAPLPYEEHVVFRSSTPSEEIASYKPQVPQVGARAPERPRPQQGFVERARQAATDFAAEMERASGAGGGSTTPEPTPTRRPSSSTTATRRTGDDNLAKHREWEERLRGRRNLP